MIRDFLKKLQQSDDARKKRWMIASTGLTMVVVIYLWLGYFNNLIADSSMQSAKIEESESGFSFGQTMKMGVGSVLDVVQSGFNGVGAFFNQPKEYILEPKN
jgi:hypothetical protein